LFLFVTWGSNTIGSVYFAGTSAGDFLRPKTAPYNEDGAELFTLRYISPYFDTSYTLD